jgi:hypothetical protein
VLGLAGGVGIDDGGAGFLRIIFRAW